MPLTPAPGPYTTNNGSLIGAVNGSNTTYTALSNQILLLYSLTGVTGSSLLFRNGLLQDPATDYIEGSGYFGLPTPVGTGTIAARVFQGGAITRLRPSEGGGLIFNGTRSIRLAAPAVYNQILRTSVMLFRNGLALVPNTDYTLTATRYIALSVSAAYVTGDVFTAIIDTGGVLVTGSNISGAINGSNTTFGLPDAPNMVQFLVYLNGKYQQEGLNYQRLGGNQFVFATAPPVGATMMARYYVSLPAPVQITTLDGSMFYPPAVAGLVFVNGLLMTQGLDATLAGNVITLARAPLPG